MKRIDDHSIDMILSDLPYGITNCKWDTPIPFEPLWKQYKRIIKDNGAIVLTASQPFTSKLVMSNLEMFKYELIWIKNIVTGYLNANRMQMKAHENILIFYNRQPTYNPQMVKRTEQEYKINYRSNDTKSIPSNLYGKTDGIDRKKSAKAQWNKKPTSILKIPVEAYRNGKRFSTRKPVALFENLIKTYTNKGELVLDNCAGSGTTGIACMNTGRNYILIEKDVTHYEIAEKRIQIEKRQKRLDLQLIKEVA